MAYYWNHTNSELKPNTAFTHGGTSFPRQWLTRSTESQRTEIGLVWRDDPKFKNEKYYRNYLLADGSVLSEPLPLDGLKEGAVAACKDTAGKMLNGSDWMAIREAETDKATPEDWMTYRQAVRDYSDTLEELINAVEDVEALIAVKAEWPKSPDAKDMP